jgi:hypothetical protein
MAKPKRLATDYLSIGDMVVVPKTVARPIIYTADAPNGKTVDTGRIVEKLNAGAVAVDFCGKVWDYSNREALQFSRVH